VEPLPDKDIILDLKLSVIILATNEKGTVEEIVRRVRAAGLARDSAGGRRLD
jgi:hypothetical protein